MASSTSSQLALGASLVAALWASCATAAEPPAGIEGTIVGEQVDECGESPEALRARSEPRGETWFCGCGGYVAGVDLGEGREPADLEGWRREPLGSGRGWIALSGSRIYVALITRPEAIVPVAWRFAGDLRCLADEDLLELQRKLDVPDDLPLLRTEAAWLDYLATVRASQPAG